MSGLSPRERWALDVAAAAVRAAGGERERHTTILRTLAEELAVPFPGGGGPALRRLGWVDPRSLASGLRPEQVGRWTPLWPDDELRPPSATLPVYGPEVREE